MAAKDLRRFHDDYTVCWLCALPIELAASIAMLDEIHESLPVQSSDQNAYTLGKISEHNIVIACLPSGKCGTVSASTVLAQLLSSFRSIRFGLMVGVGGADVRLGDIVVSKPTDSHGGVVVYNYGRKFDVPFDFSAVSAVQNFVGRENELEDLWAHLRPGQVSQNVAVVHALGGMGKTQLAVRFARAHKRHFSAIPWLSGRSQETLFHSLSSALWRLPGYEQFSPGRDDEGVKNNAARVLNWLTIPENNKWLLIFDNVDQYCPSPASGEGDEYNVREFFPRADHGSILITLRLSKVGELGKSLPLEKLDPPHASELLLQGIGLPYQSQQASNVDQAVVELIHQLDGLPLAITIAGSFIRETGISIRSYLQYYRESWHTLQSQSNSNRHYDHDNIIQAWTVSYQEIKNRDPEAAELMLFLAQFNNQDIWFELLRSGPQIPDLKWYHTVMWDELTFRAKMKVLLGFSFVNLNLLDGSYSMHPVVRDWCLSIWKLQIEAQTETRSETRTPTLVEFNPGAEPETLTKKPYLSNSERKPPHLDEIAMVSVGHLIPDYSQVNFWQLQQRLLPHVDYLVGRLRTAAQDPAGDVRSSFCYALRCVANLSISQYNYEKAEQVYQWALAICPRTAEHRCYPHICNGLGLLYDAQWKMSASEYMFQQAIAAMEDMVPYNANLPIFGPKKMPAVEETTLSNNLGALEASESMHNGSDLDSTTRDGLERPDLSCSESKEKTDRKPLSSEPTQTAMGIQSVPPGVEQLPNILSNLGSLYLKYGMASEALVQYLKAQVYYNEYFGPGHIASILHFNSLGRAYQVRSDYSTAETFFSRALEGEQHILGPEHHFTLQTMVRLARLNFRNYRIDEGEEIYEKALSGMEKQLGPYHPSTLDVIHGLAWLTHIYRKDNPSKAEALYQRELAGQEITWGRDHFWTSYAVCAYGQFCFSVGRLEDSDKLCRRALAGFQRALGPDHDMTREVMLKVEALERLSRIRSQRPRKRDALRRIFSRVLPSNADDGGELEARLRLEVHISGYW
ncbi:hypothetical protein BJY04DRAFT_217130 [Aspergillus karnatakaensis]|uniref:uncharacterized protein n=1 Tax=Aspergillus karnatakaensis TaxID=1810916 RepID=UPI003CCDA025